MDKGNFSVIGAIALNSALGDNPKFSHQLIDRFGSMEELFSFGRSGKQDLFGPYSRFSSAFLEQSLEEAEKQYRKLSGEGIQFVSIFDRQYPSLLKECPDAPLLLYVRSSSPVESIFREGSYLAMVGTRDMSSYGKEWCQRIISSLPDNSSGTIHTRLSPAIVSGLARGIDITAHLAALNNGLRTIAVSPVGVDDVYPRHHLAAAERIASSEGSAIITDYPPGTIPYPGNFLRRNRIIAGLCQSTILVESRVRGGGMMTSRLASSYGRMVFALPGRIDDPRSQGCNQLIADNIAAPIVSMPSLVTQLYPGCEYRKAKDLKNTVASMFQEREDADDAMRLCMEIKTKRGTDSDSLCELTGIDYPRCSFLLGTLESAGVISRDVIGGCFINAIFD